MATFKIGQRVRILCEGKGVPHHIPGRAAPPAGQQGTVAAVESDGCIVDVDGIPPPMRRAQGWWIEKEYLAPLIDPKADEFIERIKKLKPYEEPVAPKTKTPHY